MSKQNPETKEDILKRLRRIEGQVKGVQKMIDEEKHCIDILTQISAVRAAVNRVGSLVLEKYSETCIQNAVSSEDKEKSIQEITRAMQTFTKFSD
jgi:Uncharacterized protein conserved in bacteria